MKENWVDFKAVKEAVSFEQILAHYKFDGLQKNGDEMVGPCPIHHGDGKRAFHVSLKKNVFNCFSCKARGNVLDFVAAIEKCSVRDSAIKLQTWFQVAALSDSGAPTEKKNEEVPTVAVKTDSEKLINKPLTFQLKGIDPTHEYIVGRDISKEVAEEFGIGYFGGRGSMSGRVVIPIHNERGELVAYAGRAIDDSEPKYKLPPGFRKSVEVYNLHRAVARSRELVVVVEGYFGCIHVWKTGLSAVALMGSSLSAEQESLIVKSFQRIIVLMDGNAPGQECTDDCLKRLGRKLWVKAVKLPDGVQPDGVGVEELQSLLK